MNKKTIVWVSVGAVVGIGLGVLGFVKRKFIEDSVSEISRRVRRELGHLKDKINPIDIDEA